MSQDIIFAYSSCWDYKVNQVKHGGLLFEKAWLIIYFFLQNVRIWSLLMCAICYVRPYHSRTTNTRDGNTLPVEHGLPQSYHNKYWRWLILQIISILSVCMTKVKLNSSHFKWEYKLSFHFDYLYILHILIMCQRFFSIL